MGRAPCCDKSNVKRGPWSPEEDSTLKAYIDMYGTGGNWITLPLKIGLKRCGKSCRLRWLNYLRPNLKHGGFSDEEDNIICSLYISIGSRWSVIAAQLPGRTDNDIKNYWNTRLKKKLLAGKRKQQQSNHVSLKNEEEEIDNSYVHHALSNSAYERLQLHMQLQSIQHPFSSCAFPKLHPFQEKMIQQSLQCSDQNPHSVNLIQRVLQSGSSTLLLGQPDAYNVYKPKPTLNQQVDYQNTEISSFFEPKSHHDVRENFNGRVHDQIPTFCSEGDGFLNAGEFIPHYYDQIADFDWFKEVEGTTKDSMIWWPSSLNDFGSKSASTGSWDSSSCVVSEALFQGYA